MKKWKFIGLIVVLMLITSTTTYAVTTLYDAVEVEYDNRNSGTEEIEVQGAIDKLYDLVGKCPEGYICKPVIRTCFIVESLILPIAVLAKIFIEVRLSDVNRIGTITIKN